MKMHMKMNKQQSGFTLIELVMVIVVLGILAATALPKFVNLGTDARIAAMKAVEGSMRSANAMIYAKAATASDMGRNGIVTIEGTTTLTTRYGYALNATQLKIAMDLSDDYTVVNGSVSHGGAATPATCRVTYTAATVTEAPKYVTVTSGC